MPTKESLQVLADRIRANLTTLDAGDKERRDLILDVARDFSHAKAVCREEGKSWDQWATVTVGLYRTRADDYAVIWKARRFCRPLLGQSVEESARRARKALQLKRTPTAEQAKGWDDVPQTVERLAYYFRSMFTKGPAKEHLTEAIPFLIKHMEPDDFKILDGAFRELEQQITRIRKELRYAQQHTPRPRKFAGLLEQH